MGLEDLHVCDSYRYYSVIKILLVQCQVNFADLSRPIGTADLRHQHMRKFKRSYGTDEPRPAFCPKVKASLRDE